MELFDLTGKTAIITGSSRGIAEARCPNGEHGAMLYISSRKETHVMLSEAINANIRDAPKP